MGKTDVIAAIAAGLAGAITIGIYLTITVPLVLGAPVIALLRWDASNLLGYQNTLHATLPAIIFIGQSSHVLVSLVWGFVFVGLLRVLPAIRRMPLASGFVFGVCVMLFMHYLVVPLGHAPQLGYTTRALINNLVAHTLFFGMPVAWVATRLTKAPARSSL